MTPYVVVAVLFAAVTHASWNALAHGIKDQLLAFTLVGGGGAVCGAVLACCAPLPASAAWPYLLASVVVHLGYMTLLMQSFRLGDFSQMYPIARGTAPLVVTVLAAVFVGERPDAWQTAGVVVASGGLAGIALWGMRGEASGPSGSRRLALAAAIGTGLTIATYTVIDGVGVRASGTALGYTGWLLLIQGVFIPAYALVRRGHDFVAWVRPAAGRGLFGGVLSVTAYGLVLWAQTRADLAPISALRESSIIVGAVIGTVFFKERFGRPRLIGAAFMVAGIGLMLRGG
ncbi:DMT family transporter [Streptomyces sp. PTM05]|uniref:DMT family transporter n=1 Tax=Streptantibioticus parmotrematis TaxID=2873249 RepID=A0ABS7QWV0_9ACTN|nr:DMT family transporter [Streptantibioticus parmotrematis]MBY8887678.1 DMT family transporter [Streptantibioticus parmotrematis]